MEKIYLDILKPDDWHVHLREGKILSSVLPFTYNNFGSALVMPNLSNPITSISLAEIYYNEICRQIPEGIKFTPHMTLYLTNNLSKDEIKKVRTHEFIKAIKYLSKHSNGYDIVLRPHPVEDIKIWKTYLEGVNNVHVIREDSISAWVNTAFAVMHNGCTTAFEATISEKPLISYDPFSRKYGNELPNKLGLRVETLEDLLSNVKEIFNNLKANKKNNTSRILPKIVSEKVFIDENELAAEKIIKIWESLDNKNLSQNTNWIKFETFLKYKKFRESAARLLKKFLPTIFGRNKESYKFIPFNKHDILKRISKLQDILAVDKKLECKFLSDRTILIKKH